jgi:hypothetical protein
MNKRDDLFHSNSEMAAYYDAIFGHQKINQPAIGNSIVGTINSGVVVNGNNNRRYLLITNDSNYKIYLALGVVATLGQGIPLDPNDSYESYHDNLFVGTINAIGVGASCNLSYQEGTN